MSLKDPNVTNAKKPKRIALVLANPAVSTTTGWPVGFWWAELTHPYYVFSEHGYEVEIFSPNGGACDADAMSDPNDPSGYSSSDLISQGFIHTPTLKARLATTRPVGGARTVARAARLDPAVRRSCRPVRVWPDASFHDGLGERVLAD